MDIILNNLSTKDLSLLFGYYRVNTVNDLKQVLVSKGNMFSEQVKEEWFHAVKDGDIEKIQQMIDNDKDIINIQTNSGYYRYTALILAVLEKKPNIVRILLENGADPNIQNNLGNTALMISPPPIWIQEQVEDKLNDYKQMVNDLFKYNADPNIQNKYGETALIFAANSNFKDVIKIILDNGGNPNIQNNSGNTALIIASANNNIEIVRVLLEYGANVNIKNKNDKTALTVTSNQIIKDLINQYMLSEQVKEEWFDAVKYGNIEKIQQMIDNDKDIINIQTNSDHYRYNALIFAVLEKKPNIVRILLENGADPNIQNKSGNTALTFVASRSCIQGPVEKSPDKVNEYKQMANDLFKYGADPNIQDNYGNTALITAAISNFKDVLKIILDNGGDPNIQNKNGDTALIIPASWGFYDIVKLLLEYNANPNISNNDGNTALMVVERNLERYGPKENLEKIKQLLKNFIKYIKFQNCLIDYYYSRKEYYDKNQTELPELPLEMIQTICPPDDIPPKIRDQIFIQVLEKINQIQDNTVSNRQQNESWLKRIWKKLW